MYRNLLAKGWNKQESPKPPTHTRLLPHLRAAQAAGEAITEVRGATILDNLGLDPVLWLPRLQVAVSLACLIHDLGKANSYFQGMVRYKAGYRPITQPIRHELLTVLILFRNSGGTADWLRARIDEAGLSEFSEELFRVVVGAVAGHHVKMDSDWKKAFPAKTQGGGGQKVSLYLNHPDLQPLFGEKQPADPEDWSLLRSEQTYPGKTQFDFNTQSADWGDFLDSSSEWWRLAAAVKALTVAADVAGSALLPEGVKIRAWVRDALTREPSAERLDAVVSKRLRGCELRLFQRTIAESTAHVTLVEAGCGSGKTAAAWAWVAARANGRKPFFCYPTTGTATEGFLGYVHESDVEADLIHSRAVVDLEEVATTQDQDRDDAVLRVASLRAWWPEAIVCTVDTVLALVRNNHRGLYAAPSILSGIFVFDEIHSYDDELFSALVALIRALPGAPFLLMSASLPAGHKAFLREQLEEIAEMPPPTELEEIERYRIELAADNGQAFDQAAECVRSGGHVLWVCNTVARAQAVYDHAQLELKLPVVTYHSRFKYQDRVGRHREVIAGFDSDADGGLLAVTTQVAEMSLDLDADLLVTELAPIPALVQRLGRLNRRVNERDRGKPRPALVLKPDSASPYEEDQLMEAEDWLIRLLDPDRPLSQRDLADQSPDGTDSKPRRLDLRTEWLDSGWFADPGKVREGGFSVNTLMAQDADACRADARELIKRTIPMLYRAGMEKWPRVRGCLVAPPDFIRYDAQKGATWAD